MDIKIKTFQAQSDFLLNFHSPLLFSLLLLWACLFDSLMRVGRAVGLLAAVIDRKSLGMSLFELVRSVVPVLSSSLHKGQCGRVLIVGGSKFILA